MQSSHQGTSLHQQLMDLGFQETLINQSLKHTSHIDKAVEIILRYTELGLGADISDLQDIPLQQPVQPIDNPVQPTKWTGFKHKMIFLVNSSLKMGKGKICAQVGHACLFAYIQMEEQSRFNDKAKKTLEAWETLGCAKIVVRVDSTKEIEEFKQRMDKMGINCFLVEDAGKTQIKSGSKTVLGIGPVESAVIDPITSHLKLL